MKKSFILCAGLLPLAFCSCTSGDYVSTESEQQEQKVTVAQMKEQLLKMSPHPEGYREASSRTIIPNFTKSEWIKIAVADGTGAIKGGIRGSEGGAAGIIGGAVINGVVSSLKKATQIYLINSIKAEMHNRGYLSVCTPARNMAVEDSVGYYHNLIEWDLYSSNDNCHEMSVHTLVQKTDSILREKLPDYSTSVPSLTIRERMHYASTATRIYNVDPTQSFFDYCDEMMEAFPDYADHIDFIAQYLFDLAYANEDPEEYTTDVINMIDLSNMDYDEYISLRRGVLVAYSSYLYSSGASYLYLNQ